MENNETKEISLIDRIKQSTETKSPAGQTPSAQPVTGGNGARVGGAWTSESDFDTFDTETKETGTGTDQRQTINNKAKVSTLEKQASAETATALMDSILSTICHPILKYKLKKNFTADEWKRFKSIQYVDVSKLEGADLIFYNKVIKLNKEYVDKMNAIEMQPGEIKRHEKTFYQYFEITNTKLSPSWLLIANISTAVTDRIIEIAVKD